MRPHPVYACPRCGSTIVEVVSVDSDGRAQLRCPGCRDRWDLEAASPAVVPELRELGATLAALHRRIEIGRNDRRADRAAAGLAVSVSEKSGRVLELLDRVAS